MTMTQIPDINYKLSDDGDLLTIEQGQVETQIIQLHKIHVKHFAGLMKVSVDDDEGSPMLTYYLERMNEQAETLYQSLASVPNSHPRDLESDELILARQLRETANMALSLWGSN